MQESTLKSNVVVVSKDSRYSRPTLRSLPPCDREMDRMKIHIGKVSVPLLDYAVSCTAILGIRDSGKTVTAKGIAEQLLEQDIPIVVFDAVGKWRWMKVPGEGHRAKGFKVVVAGGRAPDLPLNPHSVAEIVRSSVKEKIPLIIDLYDPKLSKADWRRIVQQSIRIIHYEANGVAHVFLEEAAEFVPQRVFDQETYAEVEKLARMGGNASVGITMINQRSQEVNKSVLDLSHNLILGCQIGNKAIEAVEKWVDRLDSEIADEVTRSLPRLQSGEAWVWTRSNPDKPSREQMPMCRSLHPDRRTPETVLKSAKGIDPDEFVQRLSQSIPKVIEEAKANDPTELRREIARLKSELKKVPVPKAKEAIKEKPVLKDGQLDRLEKLTVKFDAVSAAIKDALSPFKIRQPISHIVKIPRAMIEKPLWPLKPRKLEQAENGSLPPGERKILIACAQFENVPKEDLTVLTGYKRSTRDAYIQRLRERGYVDDSGGAVVPTDHGITALGNWEPLPTGDALCQHWMAKLPDGERKILEALVECYPDFMERERLEEITGFKRSTRDAYLQRMKPKRIVEFRSGAVRAAEILFD